MADLTNVIKKAAVEAVKAGKPSDFLYGTVVGVNPIKISVNQKLVLSSEFLILTGGVKDYSVEASVEWTTEENEGSDAVESHVHNVTGTKKIMIHNGLKVGEKVILLMQAGGQMYIVLDRV